MSRTVSVDDPIGIVRIVAIVLAGVMLFAMLAAVASRIQYEWRSRSLSTPETQDPPDVFAAADLLVAHGRFQEAVDRVESALAGASGRTDLQRKLLEVLFVWGHKARFGEAFERYRATLSADESWPQVVQFARQMKIDVER